MTVENPRRNWASRINAADEFPENHLWKYTTKNVVQRDIDNFGSLLSTVNLALGYRVMLRQKFLSQLGSYMER